MCFEYFFYVKKVVFSKNFKFFTKISKYMQVKAEQGAEVLGVGGGWRIYLYSSRSSMSRVTVCTKRLPRSLSAMCCSHWLSRISLNLSLYIPSPRPPSITIWSSWLIISCSNSLKLALCALRSSMEREESEEREEKKNENEKMEERDY